MDPTATPETTDAEPPGKNEGAQPSSALLTGVVMPATSKLGRQVSAVEQGSMTFIKANGQPAKVSLTSATIVNKATVGTAADITQGATILFVGKAAKNGSVGTNEILVLPAGS